MRTDFESILVGVDFGPNPLEATPGSRDAISQARWLAFQTRAGITLLHSVAADERWDSSESNYVGVDEREGPAAEAALEMIAEELRSDGIATRIATTHDDAAVAIIRQVLLNRHDLVLVGKRSYERPKGGRMGTVALRIIRKCPCPAWIVDTGSAAPPKTILACTNLHAAGDLSVRLAASLALRSGGELHVTHAYQWPMDIQMSSADVKQRWSDERRREAEEHIKALIEAEQRETVKLHIGLTSPAHAIHESLDRLQPELLVMGSISRGGLPGILMGNTAERIFDSLECSLLVVKPDDFVTPIAL